MKFPPFILELISRLFSKNPKFFKIIQVISAIIAIITGLPEYLTSLGIVLPDNLITLENKTIAIASIVAMIIAQFPTQESTK